MATGINESSRHRCSGHWTLTLNDVSADYKRRLILARKFIRSEALVRVALWLKGFSVDFFVAALKPFGQNSAQQCSIGQSSAVVKMFWNERNYFLALFVILYFFLFFFHNELSSRLWSQSKTCQAVLFRAKQCCIKKY